MLLKEAKELLKRNGYRLVEDAYTDAMDAEDDEVLKKLRNDTPYYVSKLDKILLNLNPQFVKLHKQVQKHHLTYMGFITGTKYLLCFMIDKNDVITCNVIDKDTRKVQKVTMDIAIDSNNLNREYIDVVEFIKNSESYLENIQKVVENIKKIDKSSKTKLGRIANRITKALGNDFDTRYSGLRDFGEAVKLLKKNGYRLVEAYDAVTDRNNIKNKRQYINSYYTKLFERLKNALAEEGIKAKTPRYEKLTFGKWYIVPLDAYKETGFVGPQGLVDADPGPESGEDANFAYMENTVVLELYCEDEPMAIKEFDVRNTPGIVQWILDYIE